MKVGDPLRDILDEVDKAGERAEGLTRQLPASSRKQILAPRRFDVNRGIEADKLLPVIGSVYAGGIGRVPGEPVPSAGLPPALARFLPLLGWASFRSSSN